MALISGDGPNAQKAVPDGNGGMKVLKPAASRPSSGGGSSSSAPAPSVSAPGPAYDQQRGSKVRSLSDFYLPAPKQEVVELPNQAPGARAGWGGQGADVALDEFSVGAGSRSRGLAASTNPETGAQTGIPEMLQKPDSMKTDDEKAGRVKQPSRSSYRMSWDEYRSLSDQQRAAVDFNTLLVQAREKDLNTEYKPTDAQETAYDQQVRAMFGKDGGSETYAPETVSVLKQIDFEGKGRDLDQFLSLELAIDDSDLKGLGKAPKVNVSSVDLSLDEIETSSLQTQLAQKTRTFTETLAKGGQLMQSLRASATLDRNRELTGIGGLPNDKVEAGLGWGTPGTLEDGRPNNDAWAQGLLGLLTDPMFEGRHGEIMQTATAEARERGIDMKDVMTFLDTQTRNVAEYDLRFGEGKRYSPREVRQFIGLDK